LKNIATPDQVKSHGQKNFPRFVTPKPTVGF